MAASHPDLQTTLGKFPRLSLGQYPTPLEALPNLSKELGRDLYIKRDDEIGPGMGGNKTRKLEYLLADAQKRRARKVVTFGGLQSNHARITASAARRVGLEPHLFFFTRRPPILTGNLLLNELLGAQMHFIPISGGGDGNMTLESTIRLVRMAALVSVGSHYFIPVGGHSWLGCLGYVAAAEEIDAQTRQLGIEHGYLVVAAGSGGTLAGLMAGLKMVDSPLHLIGIDVGRLWKNFPASIACLAEDICARLGHQYHFSPQDVPLIEREYVGPGYAQLSPACQSAVVRMARREGVLLDPVYTGKAFAGLLDLLERGKLGQSEPVIFLHTGGAPALFTEYL